MIALIFGWAKPHAIPMRVWLAPAYLRSRWKSRRMSRDRKASMVSGRCHSEAGTMIRSVMRCVNRASLRAIRAVGDHGVTTSVYPVR